MHKTWTAPQHDGPNHLGLRPHVSAPTALVTRARVGSLGPGPGAEPSAPAAQPRPKGRGDQGRGPLDSLRLLHRLETDFLHSFLPHPATAQCISRRDQGHVPRWIVYTCYIGWVDVVLAAPHQRHPSLAVSLSQHRSRKVSAFSRTAAAPQAKGMISQLQSLWRTPTAAAGGLLSHHDDQAEEPRRHRGAVPLVLHPPGPFVSLQLQ